jgi:proline dehydrogenase
MIEAKPKQTLSFDDTEISFSYKNNKQLRQSHFLFSLMNKNWLVNIGTRLTPLAFQFHLPITTIVRNTIFKQFCGGESLTECEVAINDLSKYNVGTILDYGVEAKESDDEFDIACDSFINAVKFAGNHTSVPFISVKITGLSKFYLLEKISKNEKLNEGEIVAWNRTKGRLHKICKAASINDSSVMIDAEESWIQDAIDNITEEMMIIYNRDRCVVMNTIQLYRHDRLQFLKNSFKRLSVNNIICGYKLVRGAYMEKERKRALQNNYLSPIQATKDDTDRDYNLAIDFCLDNIERINFCVASHNECSNKKAASDADLKNIAIYNPHLHFSQLYGMSDNITFNLAKSGYNVSKYLPFGPVRDVVPYLMRRAQENTSVSGQTSRELLLIDKELKRRKK